MVQITQSNQFENTESGRIFPQTTGGEAGLQASQQVAQAVDRAASVLGKISKAADDMEVNERVTAGQLEFSRRFEERASQLNLEDGSPAADTLDSDLAKIGQDIEREFGEGIFPGAGREKYKQLMGNFVASKRVQGLGIARAQKINRATGDFLSSLGNLSKQASNKVNRDLTPSFIAQANSLIDDAVNNQLITSTKGVELKKSFSEGTHESLIRQSIDDDPLSALAVLDSDADLGVSNDDKLKLKMLAKQTLNVQRVNKGTISKQAGNAAKASMETLEIGTKDLINNSPISGLEGGFTVKNLEAVFAAIDNFAIIHTQEDIESELDPVARSAMGAENVSARKYAQNRKAEIKAAFDTRNKEALDDADRTRRIKRDQGQGKSVNESDSQFMYRNESAGQPMPVKREIAAKYNQPQPVLQTQIITAATSGNVKALEDSFDADGNRVPGIISTYSRLSDENPRVLKGMSETDVARMSYLTSIVGAGTDVGDAVDLLKTKFDTINSAQRDGFRNEFRKNDDTGKSLRTYIQERAINKIDGLTAGIGDATPQFLNQLTVLAELQYQIHGDKDAAADAVATLMQDAGSSKFPVKSQGFFSNNQELMTITPEKHMGWSPEETLTAVSKFKEEFSTIARVNGIDPDTLYIESDAGTITAGKEPTWAVWGVTTNGSGVALGRYKPSSKKDLFTHSLHQSYIKKDISDTELARVREIFGDTDNPFLKGSRTPSEKKASAQRKVFTMQERARDSVIKSRVDAVTGGPREPALDKDSTEIVKGQPTLPNIAQTFVDDLTIFGQETSATYKDAIEFVDEANQKIWENVAPKMFRFFNKYIFDPIATEAGASEVPPQRQMDQMLVDFGQQVVHDPQKAEEIFSDAQFEEDTTEVSVDDVGGINTTGLSPDEVNDRRNDRMMEDTRHLTGASDPVFSNKLEEEKFNGAMQLLHENVAAPEQVFPHEAAIEYLNSLPKGKLSGKEAYYLLKANKRAEKFRGSTPDSDNLMGRKQMDQVKSSSLSERVYESEQYRPRAYDDGLGNITIGIGWNIQPGKNDTKNQSIVNWINAINKGKTLYNLKALQTGAQTLSAEDATLILQRQITSAGKEVSQALGKGMGSLTTAQSRVATDMHFQLGALTFNTFSSFKRAINGTTIDDPKNPFNHVKDTQVRAPLEIINSDAFREQTPLRYAEHLVTWVNGSKMTPEQKGMVKSEALAYLKKIKVVNVDGNSFKANARNLITNGIK